MSECTVWIAPIPKDMPCEIDDAIPEARKALLRATHHPKLFAARVITWHTLERAVKHATGRKLNDLNPRCEANGRWVADGIWFSLSHTDGYAAVALYDHPVGVDIETTARFESMSSDIRTRFAERIAAPNERIDTTKALAHAWSVKEALYKRSGQPFFDPRAFRADDADVLTLHLALEVPCILSVTEHNVRTLNADTFLPVPISKE